MTDETTEVADAPADLPVQEPLALVSGKPLVDLPKDLYIPPDAPAVFLEAVAGPLDLLLSLIRRQNMNILDIDVSEITRQYMDYIGAVESMRLELAAEYLVMAATLAEIKSRMLLPRHESSDDEEHDPRAELIRRLQQYERFKKAAEEIDEMPRMERDTFAGSAALPRLPSSQPHPDVDMRELLLALRGVLQRADLFTSHHVERERLSTRERMSHILASLQGDRFVTFESLFTIEEGRLGVVVTFLATLELVKEQLDRIRCITEAALLAAGKPLSLDQLRELFDEGDRPARQVMEHVLVLLEQSCEGRGFELKKIASGYRLQVREEFAPWVGRLFEEKPQRYSRALLETLALIAYRQPITRGEIEEIRGVTVSSNIIRTLLEREWVRVVGHRDVPGRPAMYATTRQFLDYFNLTGLDELPPLSEVRDLEEIGREIERNMQGEIELDAPDQTLH